MRKTIVGLMVAFTLVVFASIVGVNNVAYAGEFGVRNVTIVVDDSSVYHVGENHVRVAFRSISNYRTGAYIPDVADVLWGEEFEEYVVKLEKKYAPMWERELKWKIAKYCKDNFL